METSDDEPDNTVALNVREVSEQESATLAMDADIISVLHGSQKGDMKWYQYYRALERYVYRQNPTYSPRQFTFDLQEDNVTGEPVFVIHLEEKKKGIFQRLLKYSPSIIGPILGASLSALLR